MTRLCEACGAEAIVHVSLRLDLARPSKSTVKIVQFWLCEACDRAQNIVMTQDAEVKQRVAKRLTIEPELFSLRRAFQSGMRRGEGMASR